MCVWRWEKAPCVVRTPWVIPELERSYISALLLLLITNIFPKPRLQMLLLHSISCSTVRTNIINEFHSLACKQHESTCFKQYSCQMWSFWNQLVRDEKHILVCMKINSSHVIKFGYPIVDIIFLCTVNWSFFFNLIVNRVAESMWGLYIKKSEVFFRKLAVLILISKQAQPTIHPVMRSLCNADRTLYILLGVFTDRLLFLDLGSNQHYRSS